MVGQAIASKLVSLGHEVTMGSRDANNEKAKAWAEKTHARIGTFADAARFGELLVNATSGTASLEALQAAGTENLAGKVLIDIANPIDGSSGMPPSLSVANKDSLGEQVQRAFPASRVVKTLNTMNADVMVNPQLVPGNHNVFVSGNDAQAKAQVTQLLESFGWPTANILDLGDISSARGTEMYLALWLRLWGKVGTGHFNISVVKP
jgi:predicted dinucleotide-binding enzyme